MESGLPSRVLGFLHIYHKCSMPGRSVKAVRDRWQAASRAVSCEWHATDRATPLRIDRAPLHVYFLSFVFFRRLHTDFLLISSNISVLSSVLSFLVTFRLDIFQTKLLLFLIRPVIIFEFDLWIGVRRCQALHV